LLRELREAMQAEQREMPELEVIAFGRLPWPSPHAASPPVRWT